MLDYAIETPDGVVLGWASGASPREALEALPDAHVRQVLGDRPELHGGYLPVVVLGDDGSEYRAELYVTSWL